MDLFKDIKKTLIGSFKIYKNKIAQAAFKLYMGSMSWRFVVMMEKVVNKYDEKTISKACELYMKIAFSISDSPKDKIIEIISSIADVKKSEVKNIVDDLQKDFDYEAWKAFVVSSQRDVNKLNKVIMETYKQ